MLVVSSTISGNTYSPRGRLGHREFCDCGIPIAIFTANTLQNKNRLFLTCAKERHKRCRVWEWIDPPRCQGCSETIPALQREVEQYRQTIEIMGSREIMLVASVEESNLHEKQLRRSFTEMKVRQAVVKAEIQRLSIERRTLRVVIGICMLLILLITCSGSALTHYRFPALRS